MHESHIQGSVWLDTLPKCMGLLAPGLLARCRTYELPRRLVLPNRSELWFGGLDQPERVDKILGQEYASIYCNEVSQIPYDSVQVALSRLAQSTDLKNRAYFDCNPTSQQHWTYLLFVAGLDPVSGDPLQDPAAYTCAQLNPVDNSVNLPSGYIDDVLGKLSKAQRKRFLDGEFDDQQDRALWHSAWIKRAMVSEFAEVCVAVDPAVTSGPMSDLHGLVVAARRFDGGFHVLRDLSLRGSPHVWASAAVEASRLFGGCPIVCEVNNGGDMVVETVRTVDPSADVVSVRATRGKVMRAEPVAALYEQGRVTHAPGLADLEAQMLAFDRTLKKGLAVGSPDRVDALVWAITHLDRDRPAPVVSVNWS